MSQGGASQQSSATNSELNIVAMFGGTFDPVHNGHLQTVYQLKSDLSIDEVRWVLSAQPPHRDQPGANTAQRLAMLELALSPYSGMHVDDIEVRRKGPSYTVLTLEALRQKNPDSSLVLIVGADVMQSFHTWHQYERIMQLANMIVMHRAGYPSEVAPVLLPHMTNQASDLQTQCHGNVLVYPAPAIPVSATLVRQNLQQGLVVTDWVPASVAEYIARYDLYQAAATD